MTHRTYWPELDVMRGMAVIMMVLNHFAFGFMSPSQYASGLSQSIVFISSFAPILFFFITGVGYGLAYSKKTLHSPSVQVWYKAFLLVLLEVLIMKRGDLSGIGINFLSFIALSMILLSYLRKSKFAIEYAIALTVVIVVVRYGLGPLYKAVVVADDRLYWLSAIFGIKSVPGVTYWLLPWMAYPLVGFILGFIAKNHAGTLDENKIKIACIFTGISIFGVIFYSVFRYFDFGFFRWGRLSLAFFLTGFSVLACSMTLCFWLFVLDKQGNISVWLSLRGVSSLAAVPVHYAILGFLGVYLSLPASENYYYVAMLIVLPFTFFVSKKINSFALLLKNFWHERWVLLSLACVFFAALLMKNLGIVGVIQWSIILYPLQFLLCLLLLARVEKPF